MKGKSRRGKCGYLFWQVGVAVVKWLRCLPHVQDIEDSNPAVSADLNFFERKINMLYELYTKVPRALGAC